jgi:hypothetical protein
LRECRAGVSFVDYKTNSWLAVSANQFLMAIISLHFLEKA